MMSPLRALALGLLVVAAAGCSKVNHYVVATTGTVIGVEISQNPQTQTPQGKIGYNRGEIALVPTNRPSCDETSTHEFECTPSMPGTFGARDSTDVLMELRYGGGLDIGSTQGVYQRLAVGSTAVSQPGAQFMFAKDAEGKIAPAAANAIANYGATLEKGTNQATSLAAAFIVQDGRATAVRATKYLRCLNFDPERATSLAAKYEDLPSEEFETTFKRSAEGRMIVKDEAKLEQCLAT